MIFLFFLICLLCGLGAFLNEGILGMRLSFQNIQIGLSIFTFLGLILGLIWVWEICLLPFKWAHRFSRWREQNKQDQRHLFMSEVLEALVNHDKERFPLLIKQAHTFLNPDQEIYWVVLALLQPSEEVYQKLLSFPATTLGGIYGFLQMAEGTGNTSEMRTLLEALPEKAQEVLWVKQAYLQLAYMEGDWLAAIDRLKALKKNFSKADYTHQMACCLLMAEDIDKAYSLDATQAPIVLAKAERNPSKALTILKKAWAHAPCQEIYQAYKKVLVDQPDEEKKQAVQALVKCNPGNRFSLLALADINLSTGDAPKAKEILDEYLESFPLTHQVALMMAECEREGWHHEEVAKEWEKKARNLQEKSGWICTHCGHTSGKWEPVCPACHLFNTFIPD